MDLPYGFFAGHDFNCSFVIIQRTRTARPWSDALRWGDPAKQHRHRPRLHPREAGRRSYREWRGGKVHKIRPQVIHLIRGQMLELQDRSFFTMGGAQRYDIADGILDTDSLDFYKRCDSLRRNRRQFRINHIS